MERERTSGDSGGPIDPRATVDTGRHRIALLPEVDDLLAAFAADLAGARRRVLVECYIVRDDGLGHWLASHLAVAAARGLDVRLIYDPLGSHKSADAFFEVLRAKGVRVESYWSEPKLPGVAPFPRDHGRVIVIDDAAYTGGAAWADEWAPVARGGEGWHDVSVRVEGPVVADFAALFDLRWSEASGEREGTTDFDTGDRHPDVRLIGDTPRRDSRVYEAHAEAIRLARDRIWIANAYFYPPAALLDDLTAAIERGVDVQVVLPAGSDLPIVERAARAEFADWLDRGLHLHEYAGRMMHGKYAVIDDRWATVGSFNVLPISVGLANEVNLVVVDPRFVAAVAAQFRRDLADSEAVEAATLARRPVLDALIDDAASEAMRLTDLIWGPRRERQG